MKTTVFWDVIPYSVAVL